MIQHRFRIELNYIKAHNKGNQKSQNLATGTFVSILSEARKYRLSLTVTNQYIAQLKEDIRHGIFGNVGTLMSFRVGSDDALLLSK